MTILYADPVVWGAGSPILGTPFRVAVPPEATGGHVVCITVDMPPGVHVDEHTHSEEDQVCIVLSGVLGSRVAGAEATLVAGMIQVMPRGVPHELWNAGDVFVQLVELYTPPGMEKRFAEAGAHAVAEGLRQAGAAQYHRAAH